MTDPAGWYPDPSEPEGQLRWWDGEQWTVHVAPNGKTGLTGWIGRHKILAAVLAIVAGYVVIGLLSGEDDEPDSTGSQGVAVAEESERIPVTEADPGTEESEKRPAGTKQPAKPQPRRYLVVRVVDGDTLELGNGATVRLVGIDTPERGECGYDTATDRLRALVGGRRVELGRSDEDRDRYGRLLRYVDLGAMDSGLRLIKSGLAIARYDSRDGYGRHPREDRYIAADRRSRNVGCPERQPAAPTAPPATKAPGNCGSGYAPCIPAYPPDLDCAHVNGPIRVTGDDPHGLDRDGDGIACE